MIIGDLIYDYLENNSDVLDRLKVLLDKALNGKVKCWKHLADQLGVPKKIYDTFKCSSETSPTENLLHLLKTRYPEEFTIGKLKDGLKCIRRKDVIHDVLDHQKYQKLGE